MDLKPRQKAILAAAIERYVLTAEPVGSHAIAGDAKLLAQFGALSSATVRNELAELENLGMLRQPHTSAGRVPTEASGGVRAAQADVSDSAIAAAHAAYASERDAEILPGHTGPKPSGGVGGTRTGVKCLHAHYAYHLAGGDDAVGRWVAGRIGS